MQASTFSAKSGFASQNPRLFQTASGFRKSRVAVARSDLSMSKRNNCFGLGLFSDSMRARGSIQTLLGSSPRGRSVRAQASGLYILNSGVLGVSVRIPVPIICLKY